MFPFDEVFAPSEVGSTLRVQDRSEEDWRRGLRRRRRRRRRMGERVDDDDDDDGDAAAAAAEFDDES